MSGDEMGEVKNDLIERLTRRTYLAVGLIGLLIAVTMWYAISTSARVAKQYLPLVDASMEIKLQAAMAHLWFEEIIAGDLNEDIAEVWASLDKAEWYAVAMLEGGEHEEGTFVPMGDPELRKSIQEVRLNIQAFRAIAEERLASVEQAAAGSGIDQRFDQMFNNFLADADEVKSRVQKMIKSDIQRFQIVQWILLILSCVLTACVGWIIQRFQQRQATHLAILKGTNQQLTASKQQLKASNQQLIAGEQQLKGTNQQLTASEQQLKASNQQLIAGEQQLRASNLQLKQSQQRLAFHVQQTPLAVIEWNLDFEVTEWNSAAEKVFGYSCEEALGRHPAGLIVPESVKGIVDEVWANLLAKKGGTRSTNENNTKDNQIIQCEWYNTPLVDEDGVVVGVASLVMDITETRRLQELESRAERLETAGTIAGQVAHDFNNLLAPIMAYPEFIHEELPHDHKAHAYLDSIEDAAKKIANINQDLLTFGRRGHYSRDVLDLNRLVLQVTQETQSRPKTFTIKTDLRQDLMRIKGGAAQIHRVITNLLVNAQDAMRDIGQVTIKTENYYADDVSVAFALVPKGEYVKLTVTDTGCGIPEKIRKKILDPFFSTKTTDKKHGSGLGLSVVDAVVRDHKGYLDLSSEVGQGTSFYLYFPVTREGLDAESRAELVGGTERLLVVDDDQVQREVSMKLLTKLGYQVDSADGGKVALALMRDNSYDLLVLDMVMPGGIDGAELYQKILEVKSDQKAILLSGFSETARVQEAQKLGAGAFVMKPVTMTVIAAAVRTELDRKARSSQELPG